MGCRPGAVTSIALCCPKASQITSNINSILACLFTFGWQQLVTSTARMQMEQAQRIASAVDRALEAVKQREKELQEQERQAAAQKKQEAQRDAIKQSAGKKQAKPKGMKVAPKVGERVYVPKMQGEAQVTAVKGKQITVSMGVMELTVQQNEIEKLAEQTGSGGRKGTATF